MVEMKDFLKHVDAAHLHDKICRFRGLDFKRMSYQEVQSAIMDVIVFDTPQGSLSILTQMNASYPAGTRFYRVRTLPEDDRYLPLRTMSKVADCWEPPENVVRAGRLNRDNESLLYTAPQSPVVAVDEMKIPDNQHFSLIVYESTDPIFVTMIGATPNVEGLTSEEALKARMIQDFLKHEFIRDVGVGTEYLYRISESITKDYFDLPPDVQDAWCYPSIAKKGSFNVCFRKGHRSKLKLIGAQIASVVREGDNYLFGAKVIAVESGDGANLGYHKIGSEMQQILFPSLS
ncbi:hypothetical protein LGV61_12970 [Desulfurispirillum indicum]|uniref:hypothetical protein n=1 Tax=Desulfurispirillum indicum TaxID=936456 RepID=UPI001CFC04A3|nr:hypothetical protein [Desulfurispirillum indicum]UCZ56623.1 hypothetical protein LGV61_12970 [Desulfurispirillum indicum]